VSSDVRLPELEAFRVEGESASATIRVRTGRLSERPAAGLVEALAPQVLEYDEGLGPLGFGIRVEARGSGFDVLASPLLRRSPHVLYTNVVEPILRWTFVERGFALVHGACIASGSDAYLITARTDTGKTTTILKVLAHTPACSFLSDDLTLVAPDGRVLTYPKPLTISRHTVHALESADLTRRERLTLVLQSRVHSRSGRQFAFFLTRSGLPVATINAIVQLLVPPPKYHVERLVPGVVKATEARLAGMFVIQRGGEGVTRLDGREALDILLENCEDAYGFPPYQQIEHFLHSRAGRQIRRQERAIVEAAFDTLPSTLLESSTMDWYARLPTLIAPGASVPPVLRDADGHAVGAGELMNPEMGLAE
jgi:hypothetical protein